MQTNTVLALIAERESRGWQTIGVRVPVDIKRAIEAAAAAAGRTVAKEVRLRLALADYNLQLVAEMDKQFEILRAALNADWSATELKKLLELYMQTIETLSFRYQPVRQVNFVARDWGGGGG